MKTLVIVGHPQINDSGTQQFLKRAAEFDTVKWHVLTGESYDISAEQALLTQADRIIFQFPLYWYSAPAIFKDWVDQVFTRRFSYPSAQGALVGKQLGIAVSLGEAAKHFRAGETESASISQLMVPYQAMANKMGMSFLPTFIIDQFNYKTDKQKSMLLIHYQRYLTQTRLGHFQDDEDWLIDQAEQQLAITDDANKQQTLQLILNQLDGQRSQLNELNDALKLIRDTEES